MLGFVTHLRGIARDHLHMQAAVLPAQPAYCRKVCAQVYPALFF